MDKDLPDIGIEIKTAERVAAALERGVAVVALESTVIAHGLPAPHNLEVALAMEAAIKEAGAEPATIAVIDGQLTVGIDEAQIKSLAAAPAGEVRKASRRDLAIATGLRETAATTVSATMIAAHLAGISVFATGGIGGVHRGNHIDVSADLTELGRTPVAVVCSGAKAILDIPATVEVLETHGVPLLGYGTDDLPAFYSPSAGVPVNARVDSAAEAAAVIAAQKALRLSTGLVIGVPVPEDQAIAPKSVENAIQTATKEAQIAGISGSQVTPFVLSRVSALTDFAALHANKALLINNAKIASQIAVALADLSLRGV